MEVTMERRSRKQEKPRVAGPGKGDYKPGRVWVRKSDGVEFTLRVRDITGLVFEGYASHFAEHMFRPK
jgi:hypothetical protein